MKNYFILLLGCLAFRLSAQDGVTFSCNYEGSGAILTGHGFETDDLDQQSSGIAALVDRILKLHHLPAKIQVQVSSQVNNAAAAARNGKPYILYSKYFVELTQLKPNGDWKIMGIFAHEIGHHLLFHTMAEASSRPDLELEADKWAGSTLFQLGATLEQALSCFESVSMKASLTHPARDARKQAMQTGWYEAKAVNPAPAPVPKPAPAPSPAKRDFTETATGASFAMKYLSGNSFSMGSTDGSDDEKPVHTVRVGDFHMGKYEVTVSEYLKFCDATNGNWPQWLEKGSSYHVETGSDKYYADKGYRRTGSENLPIVGVSWDNAVAYCNWLSSTTGKTYRLPTEAEWEYAARGGQSYAYSGGNDANQVGWNDSNGGGKPHPVGGKASNGYGLYDMSGNVWEWCADLYDAKFYSNAAATAVNPTNTATGTYRVLRGGSWLHDASSSRVAYRYSNDPALRNFHYGFRVVSFP
jgi:formylglycine-generating enzyme required for sulfatase activity